MARNGSGTFTRLYDFTADRDAGSPTNVISADKIDGEFDDISTALTASIAKDGQTTPTADLPMGGFKHTGVATTISARSNYAPVAVLQDGTAQWISASGTDTITATYSPAIPALVSGMELRFRAAAANATTTPTFAPNGLTAKTIVKGANTALVAGDIAGQHHECLVRYNATTDKWHLLNPVYPAGYTVDNLNSLTTDSTGGATGDFIPFVDASESNASNKVLVTDLMANLIANFTTKTAPTVSDKIMIGDAAASGAAKISTVQQLADAHNGLTQKSTPTTSDRIPLNDQAASGVAKYATIANIRDILVAAASDQETGTSATLFVTPSVQHRHNSSAKGWGSYDQSSTTASLSSPSYNVSSITDGTTGVATINWTTSFSTAVYSFLGFAKSDTGAPNASMIVGQANSQSKASGSMPITTRYSSTDAAKDSPEVTFAAFGDQ